MNQMNGYEWYIWNLKKAYSHLSDAVNLYDSLPLVRVPVQSSRYANGGLCFVGLAMRDFWEAFEDSLHESECGEKSTIEDDQRNTLERIRAT